MVSRILAAPAIACVLLGVALGAWGWGHRDEARARIIPEADIDDGGLFGAPPVNGPDPVAQTCALLVSASRLQPPDPGSFGLDPFDPSTVPATPPPSPGEVAGALIAVLAPELVYGVPGLDRPDVIAAVEAERRAIVAVSAAGGDITTDPEVAAAAADLSLALDPTC